MQATRSWTTKTVPSSLDILRQSPWMTGARRVNKKGPNLSWSYPSGPSETIFSKQTKVVAQV